MLRIIISLALLSACLTNANASLMNRFFDWAAEHHIDVPEEDHLFLHLYNNWVANDKIIEETNYKNLSYTLGHNAYSGLSSAEFAEHMHFAANREFFGKISKDVAEMNADSNYLRGVPASVDWRTKGAVSKVKNQLSCGSCWSFSSTGSLEGAYAIKYGNLVSFSEQQLVDCDNIKNGGGNLGCNGGNMEPTLQWIGKNGGICTEEAYPYVSGTTGQAGTCQKTCAKVSGSAVSKTVEVAPKSDSAMMSALAQQPVSIGLEADQPAFQLYKSGVFTAPCGTNLDHGVLVVGYGTDNGLDYYIVKNSWGTTYGENGYIRLGKGNDPATGKPYNGGAGQCGMLSTPVYPVL